MFKFFKMFEKQRNVTVLPQTYTPKETTMKAIINPTDDNRFAIVSGGATVATYARKTDARRGAVRRGYTVLETA